jgi:hypothetical protein
MSDYQGEDRRKNSKDELKQLIHEVMQEERESLAKAVREEIFNSTTNAAGKFVFKRIGEWLLIVALTAFILDKKIFS